MNRYLAALIASALATLSVISGQSFAQTATILPNAVQQFFDSSGKPASAGTVDHYIPNTSTRKTVWSDAAETTPQQNPLTLTASGRPTNTIYGDGSYRQVVKDHNGVVIWDAVTASTGNGSTPSTPTVGDGNIVGTILPWAGLVAPTNYVFAYGQTLVRTTYPLLLSTITTSLNIICTSGLNILSGLTDTQNIKVGAAVEATCIPPGTTVTAVSATAVTISANAAVSTAVSAVFFPYGNGNGSSTFNMPDFRGRTLAGRNNMGGSASANLTATYFGAQTPNALGAYGGQQSIQLATSNLPAYTPSGTITNGAIASIFTGTASQQALGPGGGSEGFTTGSLGHQTPGGTVASTQATSLFVGTAQGGTQTALTVVQPTATINYVVKVLPDTSTLVATGVASLGGMTGVLTCGANLSCSSQTVSVVLPPVITHPGSAIYASDYGVLCNGSALTDAAYMQIAINAALALGGVEVIMPEGTCPWTQNVFYNTWTSPGILTVPGIKITGQGRGTTKIDTRVANGYAISANPDWMAVHKSLYFSSIGTAGTLATNTYYVQITMNDPSGNEIRVGIPKSYAVIGATGSVSIPLQPVNTGYSYNIYFDTNSTPAHYATIGSGNAIAVAGNQTVVISAVGSAQAFPTTKVGIWQEATIQNLSITNSLATVNASGVLYFRVGYSAINNVIMQNLTANGLDIPNFTGDIDGSFVVDVVGSKFDTIAGWCINAAGNALEFSNFKVASTTFNVCGTLPTNLNTPVTISGIPNGATPVVTTSSAHNLLAGDQIAFSVTGMTLASSWYRVGETVTPTSFNLVDTNGVAVDTTSLGAFAAGTVSLSWRPPRYSAALGRVSGSGGIAYFGLNSTWRSLNFTQVNNVDLFFSDAGSSDNATIEEIDFENTYGKGLYIASLTGGAFNQGECLSAVGIGSTLSCVQLGTGFPAGGVKNFAMAWAGSFKVRNNQTPSMGFEQFQNTNIGATYQNSNRIGTRIDWQTFSGTRYSGFVFDPIPGQVQFSISAANTAKLIPIGYGATVPIHLASPGEWVSFQVPSTGITGAITGGLSATTQYNCYTYNSASAAFPIALAFECNATGTALNEGYSVKSGDTTRTFIGTAITDGSGNFQTTGTQVSWFPPNSSNVGSYLTTTGGTVASASATQVNATSQSVTSGDWDVACTIQYTFAATTTVQSLASGISTTSATLGAIGTLNSFNFGGTSIVPNGNFTITSPMVRLSLPTTTTVYCVGVTTYATSTGSIGASLIRVSRAKN